MSWKLMAFVTVVLVAAIAGARVAEDPAATTNATWNAIRAAGFAGYLLLWAAVVTGMLQHLRYRPAGAPLTVMMEAHRILSAVGLAFVAGHVFGLLVDPVVHFSPLNVVVPFTSDYRPVQVTLGVFALWTFAVVLGSTGLAGSMTYRSWRLLHYLSFPAWLMALLHGITAGTDSRAPLAITIYALSASVVAAVLVVRVYGGSTARDGVPVGPYLR